MVTTCARTASLPAEDEAITTHDSRTGNSISPARKARREFESWIPVGRFVMAVLLLNHSQPTAPSAPGQSAFGEPAGFVGKWRP